MKWLVVLTVLNAVIAAYSGRQRRRAERAHLRADARTLGAVGDRARLQRAVDRAYDAAHEFGDEPQIALACVLAHLDHCVSALPGPPGPSDDELQRWISEERW